MGNWVSPSIRDEIVDYMQRYIGLTELPLTRFLGWLGVGRSKYYGWVGAMEKTMHTTA